MSSASDEKRDTVVLGASAGGIEALQRLLPAFTREVEASVFLVQHLSADGQTVLDTVLGRCTGYHVAFAENAEAILPGRVYVAPPDHHLIVEADRVRLWRGARENRSRPAIDPLFRSAAVARRGRVIGAVLSGLLDDGAAGLVSIKRCGGLAFVQAPEDAIESEMPGRAAEALDGSLDGSLSAGALGTRLVELVGSPAPDASVPTDVEVELEMALGETSALEVMSRDAAPLPLSCPECGGPLWGIRDGRLQRFRCHTGHTFGVDSLLSSQGQQIERALWAAIKGLEQRVQVLDNLAGDQAIKRRRVAAQTFAQEASRLREHVQTLRDVLVASYHDTHRLR
jgi:two-component system, chemotaxis family, protein-glutamate methylesterase/glutaminase